MTEFDRQIFGPPDDTAILRWYEAAYDYAFVALHPFFSVEGLDPATCEHGTLVLPGRHKPENLNVMEWAQRERAARLVGKELQSSSVDDVSKLFGSAIAWRTICDRAGFADHRELNRVLRTHIGGLKADFSDPRGAERLIAYCNQAKTFLPTEGMLQPLMEHSFVELFRRAGLSAITVADEFGDEEHLVDLAALDTPTSWVTSQSLPVPCPRRLFAPDRSLLVSVHWDSFFTLILGTRERLAETGLTEYFEGFWCTDETSIDWLFEPFIPLVQ